MRTPVFLEISHNYHYLHIYIVFKNQERTGCGGEEDELGMVGFREHGNPTMHTIAVEIAYKLKSN